MRLIFKEILTDPQLQKQYAKYCRAEELKHAPISIRMQNAPPRPPLYTWEDINGPLFKAHVEYWKPDDKHYLRLFIQDATTTGEVAFWTKIINSI